MFKLGEHGLGYYRDSVVVAAATAQEAAEAALARDKERADQLFSAGEKQSALEAYR